MQRMAPCVLVVLCLLVTAPVTAAESSESGAWWGALVEWVVDLTGYGSGNTDSNLETGLGPEPNGFGNEDPDTGLGPEPNGLTSNDFDTGTSPEPNG